MDNDLQPLDNNTPRSEKITKLATSILSAFGPGGSVVSTIVNESSFNCNNTLSYRAANNILTLKEIAEANEQIDKEISKCDKKHIDRYKKE